MDASKNIVTETNDENVNDAEFLLNEQRLLSLGEYDHHFDIFLFLSLLPLVAVAVGVTSETAFQSGHNTTQWPVTK